MKQKVERISRSLAERISHWDGVVAIVLGESAAIETIDPYFNIDVDVYHVGTLLETGARKGDLGGPSGFETSPGGGTDHFLVEQLPVSVTYKPTRRIEAILRRVRRGEWAFRGETTNLLYRVRNGQRLHCDGEWFEKARKRLAHLPDRFWDNLKDSSRIAMERAMRDLGAAVFRRDYFYYQVAFALFVQGLSSFLFALNRQFEPSRRLLMDHITDLGHLPDEFSGRFEKLIRPDIEITPQRRYELAQLIVKSLSYL